MTPDQTLIQEGLTPISDRFGAVFAKELRQGLRARLFVWPFVAIQLLAIVSVLAEFVIFKSVGQSQTTGILFLGIFYSVVFFVFTVVLPFTLFGSLQSELGSGRNIELLLMSNLTRWEIVRNKWLVGSVLAGLMLISLIPYAVFRYYLGGVSIPVSLTLLFSVLVGNAAMNGIMIGASGFKNYLVRGILISVCIVSCSITTMLCLSPVASAAVMSSSVSFSAFAIVGRLLLGTAAAALFIAYGLQLARAQLRLYENPIDPPSSGLIIALIIFTPIIVGVTTLTTYGIGGYGGCIGSIGLFVLTLFIDRGPGKNSNIRYAQP